MMGQSPPETLCQRWTSWDCPPCSRMVDLKITIKRQNTSWFVRASEIWSIDLAKPYDLNNFLYFLFLFLQAVFESRLREQSVAVPLMCCAADMLAAPSRKQVVIAGNKASPEFNGMVSVVYSSYDPNRRVSTLFTWSSFFIFFSPSLQIKSLEKLHSDHPSYNLLSSLNQTSQILFVFYPSTWILFRSMNQIT